jgi:ATP-dependent helicase/nuclease subunit A
MVGDVKQSIYGFRLADPDIFLQRQRAYVEGAKNGGKFSPIFFNDNFRSDNQILQFVNGVFESIMTEDSAGVDYKNKASFTEVVDTERNEGKVEVHVFQQGESTPKYGQKLYSLVDHQNAEQVETALESEGRFIAEEIKRLAGRTMLNIKGEQRLITYGDFALLFRKRGKASKVIIDQLKKYGIPVDEGTFSNDDTPAESELISMLNVIDNPRQDYALAGYMLSYLGGYTEDEMARIVAHSRDGLLYDKVIAYSTVEDGLGDKIRTTLADIDGYRTKASVMGVKEFVEAVVADTALDAYLSTKGQSFVGGLEIYLKTISPEATSLARYLREYKEGGREDKGRPAGGDKVHVSTYHSYKGLETPVVFLPNANGRKTVGASRDLNVEAGGCIAMSYYNLDKKDKTSSTVSNKASQILMQEKEYKEEMRLLYVALTRAQKYMYITGVANFKGDSFSIDSIEKGFACESFEKEKSIFNYVFTARRRGTLSIVPHIHTTEGDAPRVIEQKPFLAMGGQKSAFDEELEREIAKGKEFVYPHQEETELSMKYTVTQLNAEDAKDLVPSYPVYEDDDDTHVGISAAAVGTIYHKVMEHIDFSLATIEEVTSHINLMVDEGKLTAQERALVKDFEVHKAIMNPVIKSVAGEECYHEQPFMMYVPAKDVISGSTSTDKVLVQGVIDLLVKGKSNLIIDFKYTTFRTELDKEKYKKQLYLYKMAYEHAFGEKIDKVVLLSLKTGESFEL